MHHPPHTTTRLYGVSLPLSRLGPTHSEMARHDVGTQTNSCHWGHTDTRQMIILEGNVNLPHSNCEHYSRSFYSQMGGECGCRSTMIF